MTWDLQEEAKWIMDRIERKESPDPELDRLSHSVLTVGKSLSDSIDRLAKAMENLLADEEELEDSIRTVPREPTMAFLESIKESLIEKGVLKKEGNNEDR